MFDNYETLLYPFKIGQLTVEKLVRDITTNLKIQTNVVDLVGFFSDYIIGDGETPEIIAWKVYGDAKLHYLVMLANSLYDWRKDDGWHKWHAFKHGKFALKNAIKEFNLTDQEKDMIKKHMWPVTIIPPRTKEGFLLTFIDKYCALMEMVR